MRRKKLCHRSALRVSCENERTVGAGGNDTRGGRGGVLSVGGRREGRQKRQQDGGGGKDGHLAEGVEDKRRRQEKRMQACRESKGEEAGKAMGREEGAARRQLPVSPLPLPGDVGEGRR